MLEDLARKVFKDYTNKHSNLIKVDDKMLNGQPYLVGHNITLREVLQVYVDFPEPEIVLKKRYKLTEDEIKEIFSYIIGLMDKAF